MKKISEIMGMDDSARAEELNCTVEQAAEIKALLEEGGFDAKTTDEYINNTSVNQGDEFEVRTAAKAEIGANFKGTNIRLTNGANLGPRAFANLIASGELDPIPPTPALIAKWCLEHRGWIFKVQSKWQTVENGSNGTYTKNHYMLSIVRKPEPATAPAAKSGKK